LEVAVDRCERLCRWGPLIGVSRLQERQDLRFRHGWRHGRIELQAQPNENRREEYGGGRAPFSKLVAAITIAAWTGMMVGA
jgi:hypothetical protein